MIVIKDFPVVDKVMTQNYNSDKKIKQRNVEVVKPTKKNKKIIIDLEKMLVQ